MKTVLGRKVVLEMLHATDSKQGRLACLTLLAVIDDMPENAAGFADEFIVAANTEHKGL